MYYRSKFFGDSPHYFLRGPAHKYKKLIGTCWKPIGGVIMCSRCASCALGIGTTWWPIRMVHTQTPFKFQMGSTFAPIRCTVHHWIDCTSIWMNRTPLNLWGLDGDDRNGDGADFFIEMKGQGIYFDHPSPSSRWGPMWASHWGMARVLDQLSPDRWAYKLGCKWVSHSPITWKFRPAKIEPGTYFRFWFIKWSGFGYI